MRGHIFGSFTAISLALIVTPASAWAQAQGGDTTINGTTKIDASASNVTTTAENHSHASTRIGAISGSKIDGDTTIHATGSDITTSATDHSTADTGVGAIKDATIKGTTTITATASKITTTAKGNSCAETEVGTIGTDPCSSAPQ